MARDIRKWLAFTLVALVVLVIYLRPMLSLCPTDPEVSSYLTHDDYGELEPWLESQMEEEDQNDRLRPEIQMADDVPGSVPPVVHYTWCGDKKFRFKDYLSILSAIKIFQPLKLVFHFTHEPQTDDYNSWFKMLRSSLAKLEMQKLAPARSCGSKDLLKTALGFLSGDGGIFLSEAVIVSRRPKDLPRNFSLWSASSNGASFIIANRGFSESVKNAYLENIASAGTMLHKCSSVDDYNLPSHDTYCVFVPDDIYPRDIIEARTPFAELARWLFYGKRAPAVPEQDPKNLIPRITHYVRMKGKKNGVYDEFAFIHFMSVLSALYVAGFERVYVHVDEEPSGQWWKELAKENVTVVKGIRPVSVYQNKVDVIQHVSDVQRYLLLYKYGGAYQDLDVFWTSPVADFRLSYPVVAAMDWPSIDSNFPDTINLGVILARPHAEWLHYFIQSHKDFRDDDWGFNSLRMSYKTYELHPHLMYLDRKLQVLCCNGLCHPTWEKGYVRPPTDLRPTLPFRWQDVQAIHTTCSKPHPSMATPKTVKERKDMFAEIGRFILEKSGRKHLLA